MTLVMIVTMTQAIYVPIYLTCRVPGGDLQYVLCSGGLLAMSCSVSFFSSPEVDRRKV